MPALIRYNADRTKFDATTPDGVEFAAAEFEPGLATVLADDDGPSFVIIHRGFNDCLDEDVMYRLVPVATEVEDDADLSDGDDGGPDDGEEVEVAA